MQRGVSAPWLPHLGEEAILRGDKHYWLGEEGEQLQRECISILSILSVHV